MTKTQKLKFRIKHRLQISIVKNILCFQYKFENEVLTVTVVKTSEAWQQLSVHCRLTKPLIALPEPN
jgi:hypothetical protein